jgi:AcrR family transcriptional regulator
LDIQGPPEKLYAVKIILEKLDIVKIIIYHLGMLKKPYHHGDLKNALIQAAIAILSEEGAGALSLRKAASRAGVSHAAPYAHFRDKQDLIAAISTEGFRLLYEKIGDAIEANPDNPASQLMEVASAYMRFSLENQALFKIMFSGILEEEAEYPDFVQTSHENFQQIVGLVLRCQQAGLLRPGPEDAVALSVWSLVHGFVALLLEGQISHTISERYALKELLRQTLNHITLVELPSPAAG